MAIDAFNEALQESTRERVPMLWAMTKMNLGNTLKTLGERKRDAKPLELAVEACNEALKEYTQEKVRLQWAMTHANLAALYCSWYDLTQDAAFLEKAKPLASKALEVFTQSNASYYIGWANRVIATIQSRRDDLAK